MANPLSKSKIIAYITDKVSTEEKPVSKKQTVLFFDELFKLAVKENQERRQVRDPGHWSRRQGSPQGSPRPQPGYRRNHQDQGKDRCALARSESVQRRRPEVGPFGAEIRSETPRHARPARWARGLGVLSFDSFTRRASCTSPQHPTD